MMIIPNSIWMFLLIEIDLNQSCLIVGGDLNLVLGDLDYSGSRVCHSNVRSRDMVIIIPI